MKRSTALAPLSRDHHHALDAALRLRRAEPETLMAATGHFLRFFEDEGERHFEIEEEILLDALPEQDEEWAPAVARLKEDHAAIRRAVAGFREEPPDVDAARALGERLHDHVRFEERELFGILERRLPEEQLARLGEGLAAAR